MVLPLPAGPPGWPRAWQSAASDPPSTAGSAYRRKPPRGRDLLARGAASAADVSVSMARQVSMKTRAAGARLRPRR